MWWREQQTLIMQSRWLGQYAISGHDFVFVCLFHFLLSCHFCVAYQNCKPRYVMIQDMYSWLDLSRRTERLSRGLLLSKIGSILSSAKLPKFKSFRKRPFCNGRCNTLSKIIFYLVFRSSLLLRFHTPAFLQSACLLSADYSLELCSHRPTFRGLDL